MLLESLLYWQRKNGKGYLQIDLFKWDWKRSRLLPPFPHDAPSRRLMLGQGEIFPARKKKMIFQASSSLSAPTVLFPEFNGMCTLSSFTSVYILFLLKCCLFCYLSSILFPMSDAMFTLFSVHVFSFNQPTEFLFCYYFFYKPPISVVLDALHTAIICYFICFVSVY